MSHRYCDWRERDWAIGEEPTLVEIRDSLVDCFATTHGPRFGETRSGLGLDDTMHAIRGSGEGMVRLAVQLAGGSYDRPTPGTTAKVATILAERSLEWGIPDDVVFEHHQMMTRSIGRISLAGG